MKLCTKCDTTKSKDCFRKYKGALQHYCKDCQSEYNRKYYSTINGKFSQYKYHACRRGISFELTLDDFGTFWNKDCRYCGEDIATIGIDRIRANEGYTIDELCFKL